MPGFNRRITLNLTHRVKAFLGVEAGLTRGEAPDPEQGLAKQTEKLRKAHRRIERQDAQLLRLRESMDSARGGETELRERIPEPIRVVHVSANDVSGGAARAAHRLHTALRRMGHESSMFVAHQKSGDTTVKLFQPSTKAIQRSERQERRGSIAGDFAPYEESRPEIHRIGDSFNDDRSPFSDEPLEQLPPCDVVNLHVISGFIDHQMR